VQVLTKAHGEVIDVEHVGSAHTDADLALLLAAAREQLHPGQGELELGSVLEVAAGMTGIADWTSPSQALPVGLPGAAGGPGRAQLVAGSGRVVRAASLLLWGVLADAYDQLGFTAVADEAFEALVLARIIELSGPEPSRQGPYRMGPLERKLGNGQTAELLCGV
jgi:hypothetical protein